MRGSRRTTTTLLAGAVAALVWTLCGCAFGGSVESASGGSPSPTRSHADARGIDLTHPSRGGASDEVNPQRDLIGDHQAVVDAACGGRPSGTDLGARSGARGSVYATDADGRATVYRVIDGDSYTAIVERFCLDSTSFATINSITNIGQVYAGDVYAFTADAAADARRAEGLDFPACPRDGWGYPQLASISWQTLPGDRARAAGIGQPIDTGAAGTAQGEARTSADGALVDYVVAPGDTWRGIEDRFCIDLYYVASLTGLFGEYPMIHPEDVIPLTPQYLEISTL